MSEDRTPDFELKVWLSPAGYQADFVVNGETAHSRCRDFRGSMTDPNLVYAWLRIESRMMLERLRKVIA